MISDSLLQAFRRIGEIFEVANFVWYSPEEGEGDKGILKICSCRDLNSNQSAWHARVICPSPPICSDLPPALWTRHYNKRSNQAVLYQYFEISLMFSKPIKWPTEMTEISRAVEWFSILKKASAGWWVRCKKWGHFVVGALLLPGGCGASKSCTYPKKYKNSNKCCTFSG